MIKKSAWPAKDTEPGLSNTTNTEKQTNRQTNKQTNRQTNKQTNKQQQQQQQKTRHSQANRLHPHYAGEI